jgi:hypothetical protein
LIDKRAKERQVANAEEAVWKKPNRRRQQMQRDNALAWAAPHKNMARVHHDLATELAAKADALIEREERS